MGTLLTLSSNFELAHLVLNLNLNDWLSLGFHVYFPALLIAEAVQRSHKFKQHIVADLFSAALDLQKL